MEFFQKLEQLKNKHGDKKISLIIGDPIEHSLSPIMHNIAYKNLNIDNYYVYDKISVKDNELEYFFSSFKEINKKYNCFIGLTCTMPHKINIIQYLDEIKEEAKIIKAVNSIYCNSNKYIGYNTDWYGIERPFLERDINLKNKKVAIIGSGGASRSAIYAFKKHDCQISIFNRTKSKADLLSKEFNCSSYELNDIKEIKNNDIIINTTNVGMGDMVDSSPINLDIITDKHVIFDCIYKPKETLFVKKGLEKKSIVIYGWEMLLYQGVKQFEIYIDKTPPIEPMRSVL